MPGPSKFRFVAGHPALDFLNTVAWRLSDEPEERIESFDDLVSWARRSELIDPSRRRALIAAARRSPGQAAEALAEALRLREVAYALIEASMAKAPPPAAKLRRLNEFLARYEDQVVWSDGGYTRRIAGPASVFGALHFQLTKCIADFLTSPVSLRVGQCHDDRGCGWVFIDRSRSKARRWCSMAECGNRAKAQRHYRRSAN